MVASDMLECLCTDLVGMFQTNLQCSPGDNRIHVGYTVYTGTVCTGIVYAEVNICGSDLTTSDNCSGVVADNCSGVVAGNCSGVVADNCSGGYLTPS